MVGEVVVLFECGSRLGKESVVSCTFALSFSFTFLLFRLFGSFVGFGDLVIAVRVVVRQ